MYNNIILDSIYETLLVPASRELRSFLHRIIEVLCFAALTLRYVLAQDFFPIHWDYSGARHNEVSAQQSVGIGS